MRTIRLTALERTKDLPILRLAETLFKTWMGAILLPAPPVHRLGVAQDRLGEVTDPAWMSTGKAVSGFAAGALERGTAGDHPAVAYGIWQDCSASHATPPGSLLPSPSSSPWRVAIGVALIPGVFTGIAAFFGATLNLSSLLSGVAGVNPAFLAAQVLLVAAWRVAGQVGADHWLLDRLGTIGQPGRWFTGRHTPTPA